MRIQVKIKGVAPLLMHKFFIEGTDKVSRGKKVYEPTEEAEKVTYRNDKGELILPSIMFKACMTKAATDFIAKGKKTYKDFIKSGIVFDDTEIILDQQEYKINSTPMVVNRSRIVRHRPEIKDWSCSFVFEIIDETWLNKDVVKEILETAGKFKGVGDSRPEFGRFVVE